MPTTDDHKFQAFPRDTSASLDATGNQTTHSDALGNLEHSAPAGSELAVLAPMTNFVPPLEGEAAMLTNILGNAFVELIERD